FVVRSTAGPIQMGYSSGGDIATLTLATSGNVGIGTVSPVHSLHIQKNAAGLHIDQRIENTNASGYSTLWMGSGNDGFLRGGSTASAWTNSLVMVTSGTAPLVFAPNAAEAMRIVNGGNVGI